MGRRDHRLASEAGGKDGATVRHRVDYGARGGGDSLHYSRPPPRKGERGARSGVFCGGEDSIDGDDVVKSEREGTGRVVELDQRRGPSAALVLVDNNKADAKDEIPEAPVHEEQPELQSLVHATS